MIRQMMVLEQRQSRSAGPISPIIGLTGMELVHVLEQSLDSVRSFREQNPEWEDENPPANRKNYFSTGGFINVCNSVPDIPKSKYLETPEIIVEKNGAYTASYNADIDKRVEDALAEFTRAHKAEPVSPELIFTRQFQNDRKWGIEKQLEIVTYICEVQDQYLQERTEGDTVTGTPLALRDLSQRDVAIKVGVDNSTVCRLVRNLSVQLPNGEVIFANELMPANKISKIQGHYAMKELQKDPDIYEDGKWKLNAKQLIPVLKERFGLERQRRAIANYMSELKT